MPLSAQKRVQLAERLYALGPQNLTSDPRFRQILDEYVDTGDLAAIGNARIRAMLTRIEDLELDHMTPDQIDGVVRQGMAKYLNIIVKDPETRDFMQDFISEAPLNADDNMLESYVTDAVTGFIKQQAGDGAGQFQMNWDALQQAMRESGYSIGNADFDDPVFSDRYFTLTVQGQFPGLTEAETRRAVAEYQAINKEIGLFGGGQRRSIIPDGCVLPLTFLAIIAFLYGVMGLLLLLMVGTISLPLFWQTEVGQALNATLFLMGILGGIYGWLRRRGIRSALIQFIFGGMLLASAGLVVFQLIAIDTDALAQAATVDIDQTIGAVAFGVTILTSGLLWLRARSLNLLILGIVLAVWISLFIWAQQSGLLDLSEINLDIFNTSDTRTGFE